MTAALVNLGLNLATVRWLGLYGVLLSSVFSIVVVQIPWLFHNLFQEVFPRQYMGRFIRLFCGLTAVALVSCGASWFLCGLYTLNVWPALLLNAAVSFVVPNLFYFAVYGRNPVFRESLSHLKRSFLHGELRKRCWNILLRQKKMERIWLYPAQRDKCAAIRV